MNAEDPKEHQSVVHDLVDDLSLFRVRVVRADQPLRLVVKDMGAMVRCRRLLGHFSRFLPSRHQFLKKLVHYFFLFNYNSDSENFIAPTGFWGFGVKIPPESL